MALVLLAVLIVLAALPSPASALERFDFEQSYLVLPGRYVKDHTFIRRGDEWHCFMIVGDGDSVGWRVPGNEVSFAHASTKDFRHWTLHPDVGSIGTGTWDERNIWAPDVIRWGSGYRMYYTGVDSGVAQQMGLAESPDLFDWRPSAMNPLYHPDSTWADWGPRRWSDCRDPDVFALGDSVYVLHTSSTKGGLAAIDWAVSVDGVSWRDRGPLYVSDTGSALESPRIHQRRREWYLFLSDQAIPGISVLRAPDVSGPWTKATRRRIASGQAGEVFGNPSASFLSRFLGFRTPTGVIRYALRVDPLQWDGSGNPALGSADDIWSDWSPARRDDPDPEFGEVGLEILHTDLAFAVQPTFGENPSLRGETVPVGPIGNSWVGTRERYSGPASGTAPGGMVGNAAVGAVRSRTFRVRGTAISFHIGGDADPERLFIALRDAGSHEILARTTAGGSETLEPRSWETASLYGRPVYLQIVDASPSGHLNVDEIVEQGSRGPRRDTSFPGHVFAPHPNPFRGGTVAQLRIDRPTLLTVDIHDAGGRLVRRVWSGRVDAGQFRFAWNGESENGAAAAGVYFFRVEADGMFRTEKIVHLR